jgi:hypothetical protein
MVHIVNADASDLFRYPESPLFEVLHRGDEHFVVRSGKCVGAGHLLTENGAGYCYTGGSAEVPEARI